MIISLSFPTWVAVDVDLAGGEVVGVRADDEPFVNAPGFYYDPARNGGSKHEDITWIGNTDSDAIDYVDVDALEVDELDRELLRQAQDLRARARAIAEHFLDRTVSRHSLEVFDGSERIFGSER